MELLLSQHQFEYYIKSNSQIPDRLTLSPIHSFRDVNCRTFQSGAGSLPLPYSLLAPSTTKKASVSSPKTIQSVASSGENDEHSKIDTKNNFIPIVRPDENGSSFNDEVSCVELWAGPTYSNSPSPGSLPIPKFSLWQKRSVSLDLPALDSGVKIHPLSKSAPPSPSRETYSSTSNFFLSAASATVYLRRILHVDVSDD